MKYKEIVKEIEKIAPLKYGEVWDNTGTQILAEDDKIKGVLVCLDVTQKIIDEAIEKECNMIISHHPLFFDEIKKIDVTTREGKLATKLIKNNISCYSSHITFDNCPGGNNEYLGKMLDLKTIKTFDNTDHPGILGSFTKAKPLSVVCDELHANLNIPVGAIKIIGNLEANIKKVAICTGAGGELLGPALEKKCDLLITGDTKHHQGVFAMEMGINLVDATHYYTEKIFIENMSNQLEKRIGSKVKVFESQVDESPFLAY